MNTARATAVADIDLIKTNGLLNYFPQWAMGRVGALNKANSLNKML